MVTMFSEYCAEPFKIEPVEVEYYSGKKEITPSLKYWEESVDPEYIRRQIGLPQDVTAETMAKLLSRMGLVSRNCLQIKFLLKEIRSAALPEIILKLHHFFMTAIFYDFLERQ